MGNVKHPDYYNVGNIEVWDFIHDKQLNFNTGNAVKYICRAGRKDPSRCVEDLQKAVEYLNKEIELKKETEKKIEQTTPKHSGRYPWCLESAKSDDLGVIIFQIELD